MARVIDKAKPEKIIELLNNIKQGINSMISDYIDLYDKKEISLLKTIIKMIDKELIYINNNHINAKRIDGILSCEISLKPFIFRCWKEEINNGNLCISWLKDYDLKDMPEIVSATFGIEDAFCGSQVGILYNISIDSFLGASSKDAATIIEENSEESIYTLGKSKSGKTINSYNLATTIITPAQTMDKSNNDYKSKHNEIILDSRFIVPIKVICTSESDLEFANKVRLKYNIPIEYIGLKKSI